MEEEESESCVNCVLKAKEKGCQERGRDPVKHTPQRDLIGQCPLHLVTRGSVAITETTGQTGSHYNRKKDKAGENGTCRLCFQAPGL